MLTPNLVYVNAVFKFLFERTLFPRVNLFGSLPFSCDATANTGPHSLTPHAWSVSKTVFFSFDINHF